MKIAFFAAASLSLLVADAQAATPPRFDLSAATGRRDAETRGWPEWEIGSEAEATRTVGDVTVTLRGVGAPLEGFLHKPRLADGATLASDGVHCAGDAIEIVLSGLPPGRHSLATFHNQQSGEPATQRLAGPGSAAEASPSIDADDDAKMPAAYVEFSSTAGQPVTLRLTAPERSIVLNAIEIDRPDPALRAAKPQPADGEGHVDGESGQVTLAWRPVDGAKAYRVYLAKSRNAADAVSQAESASFQGDGFHGERSEPTATVSVAAKDSLQHYAWRVDAVLAGDEVIQGDVWTFRVRHLAFPGAEGYGRFARGGRGGRVLHVTNLDDSGPGSLRAAVEADGPRTVVFDVAGRIVLESRLIIRNDALTIAGQTAPGEGVCVSNYNLGALGANDLVLRYLRVRPGDTSGKTLDGMGLASCDNAIVDHCSISWTQDESFSSRGAKNITLQRTLISEALNIAGHKKYAKGKSHGFAASIGGDIGSFHHNLLAHCAGRNWSLAGGTNQANRHAGRLDLRNNVVFNWEHRTTDGGAKQVQFVNNYYKPGPATRVFHVLKPEREWTHVFGPQDYYAEGNVMEGRYGPADDRYAGVVEPKGEPLSTFFSDEPFFPSHVSTESADVAYEDVLADVGCNVPSLDAHDQRVLQEVRTGKTTYKGSVSGLPGLPDSQEDVGGWDDYPEVHRSADWDADGDGLPGEWESAHGLDPADPGDAATDPDGDGYTNLEDYLNHIAN
ncbi:hypothetical protein Pla108_18250 [Botrimarina colliarenosi]|uniref:Pectate lyase n=1 Tax=Botrimarina colliarenosi TaxID=2528001 RepID=A0A5C6AHL0_9BACT|nr:T9SS C-terminal target domain-containing protein [Botrimarina colliarenosi]TWT97673.1 hypothetical protein Pla108_18250 [Botrimarina colliarenosi]